MQYLAGAGFVPAPSWPALGWHGAVLDPLQAGGLVKEEFVCTVGVLGVLARGLGGSVKAFAGCQGAKLQEMAVSGALTFKNIQ